MDTNERDFQSERHLRRKEAAKYIVDKYAMPCSAKTLAKIACVSSTGPPFRLAGRFPIYPISGLDAWAMGKIGPLIRSTAQAFGEPEINRTAGTTGAVKTGSNARSKTSTLGEDNMRRVDQATDAAEADLPGGKKL
jgi:hypothetical protein